MAVLLLFVHPLLDHGLLHLHALMRLTFLLTYPWSQLVIALIFGSELLHSEILPKGW